VVRAYWHERGRRHRGGQATPLLLVGRSTVGRLRRLEVGGDRFAAVLAALGGDALVNLVQLGMHRLLARNVLSVQPGDELGIRLLPAVVRVVPITQIELPTGGGMITHPPAAGLMTVVLLHNLVYTRSNRPDNGKFRKSEPNPDQKA
jgi:hypothetical protein